MSVVYSLLYSKGLSQYVYCDIQWSYVDWDSVVGIATPYTWTVQELNPGGGLALGPTHLMYSGYWVSFLGVKQLGHGNDHLP